MTRGEKKTVERQDARPKKMGRQTQNKKMGRKDTRPKKIERLDAR